MNEEELMNEQEFWDLAALNALRAQCSEDTTPKAAARLAAEAADALSLKRKKRIAQGEEVRDTDPAPPRQAPISEPFAPPNSSRTIPTIPDWD